MVKWKQITGYDDNFMISTNGDIKSFKDTEEGILLEKGVRDGNECVTLSIEGGTEYTYYVETLMRRYFPEKYHQTVWKKIKGFDGMYMISSSANVKSFKGSKEGIVLKKRCRRDREYVTLYKDGREALRYIDLLMRQYFPEEEYKDFKSKF